MSGDEEEEVAERDKEGLGEGVIEEDGDAEVNDLRSGLSGEERDAKAGGDSEMRDPAGLREGERGILGEEDGEGEREGEREGEGRVRVNEGEALSVLALEGLGGMEEGEEEEDGEDDDG